MAKDLDKWRRAGRIGAAARDLGVSLIRVGASRRDVAEEVERLIRSQGAQPSFPVNLSRNNEAAHYTPGPDDEVRFATGDVVKCDVGAHIDGCISDTAATVEVGTRTHTTLVQASRQALLSAEPLVRAGLSTNTIAETIEKTIRSLGLKPVVNLTGHTIDHYLLHAGKSIPNAAGYPPATLEAGEVIAIEPFATNGAGSIENGTFGNIMRFRSAPSPEKFPEMAELYGRFRTLPFCARWVEDPDVRELLGRFRKQLQTYPVFMEEGRGWVSQAEHSLLVLEDGAEVLTP